MILLQLFLAGLASAHIHGAASPGMLSAELQADGQVKQVNMVEQANEVASRDESKMIRKEDIQDALLAPVSTSTSDYAKGDFFGFFGLTGFVLCVYLMIRQPYSDDLRRSAWSMLSRSVAVFCAVLGFMASRKFYRLCVGPSGAHPHWDDVASFSRFLLYLFVLPVIADRLKMQNRTLACAAVQELASILIGFAASDGAAEFLREDPWAKGAGFYFLGVLLMCLLLAPCMALAARQRGSLQQVHIEAIGFCVGFLICVWLRFCITGFVPGSKTESRGLTYHDVIYLFLVTLGFKLVYIVAAMTLRSAAGNTEKPMMAGFAKITRETSAMTLAWLCLYSVQWFCVYTFAPAHAGTAGLYDSAAAIPFFTSIIVITSMVAVDMVARRMGRSAGQLTELTRMYAILIGFANEMQYWSVFIEGKLSSRAGFHPEIRISSVILRTLLTLVILLPLWVRFILPKSFPDSDGGADAGPTKDEGDSSAAASADKDADPAAPATPDQAAAAPKAAAAAPVSAPESGAPAEPKKDGAASSEEEF
eukprot:TRINITY_DN10276_c0_g1_i1.p1 TRINITY_DN10276_c0_g1~~TRINITY_DN10276_c0_g1_i1.p1  ORF type:complete len:534 (+),score=108.51 TRINITY_DN10276_c0_g1_i1:57-1658(+)